MLARSQAQISLSALRQNAQLLSRRAAVRLIAPVKANAYGHGLELVVRALEDLPEVWGFAVAMPREAQALAALRPSKPVLLLTPAAPQEFAELADLGVRLNISTAEEVAALPKNAKVHLKVETGMNRNGARPIEAVRLGQQLTDLGMLEGVYTHFARADEPDLGPTRQQLEVFQTVLAQLPSSVSGAPLLAHAANGGGVLGLGQVEGLSLARPGLALYGYAPEHLHGLWPLRPAMRLMARVGSVHRVYAGETIGYGGLYTAERDQDVATVQFGYADGYPRNATLKAQCVVAGQVRPVRGRICMDQFMLDVSGLSVKVGDWVEVWGNGPVTLGDVAAWGDTVDYEVLTGLGERVERVSAE
ncbi:alanine racemase [Deinococcus psychrotolerans]|uniref:Alanine racemase n=1 Tax=Deinococcus psychrotolerans TaxID=2489213 RepID=A0A3G8YQ05_9DEIO|nr:alanine racemase [Deinococcus psychrotolerans]AZI43266.1 alanine racemase [Deinococcus psychrotolerans]